jgi:hypothetical protein
MTMICESYITMTCGQCGHQDDFLNFCHTPITGDLPRGTHQCPSCQKAWIMEPQGKGTLHPSGLYIPPARKSRLIPTIP